MTASPGPGTADEGQTARLDLTTIFPTTRTPSRLACRPIEKWTPEIGQCGKWNLPRGSGCQIAASLIEVHRIRGASVQCAVTAPGVIETEVAGQTCPKLGRASHFRARWRITLAALTSASSTRPQAVHRNSFPLRFSASTCPHAASVRLESMAGSLSARPPATSMAFASVVCATPHTRPALEVADILRQCAATYRHTHRLSVQHQRVVNALRSCRTAALGGFKACCDHCGAVATSKPDHSETSPPLRARPVVHSRTGPAS